MTSPFFRSSVLSLLSSLALIPAASAAVVYHDGGNVTTPVAPSYDETGVWFNFFTGAVNVIPAGGGFLPSTAGQYQLMLNSAVGWLNFLGRNPSGTDASWSNNTFNGVERVGTGLSVDVGDTFTSAFTIMASMDSFANEWDGLGRGYIGVRFSDELANTYYGYVDVTVNADYTATLHGFAYENVPNGAITTGAVPEPATLGLAALGVVAFCGRRRLSR